MRIAHLSIKNFRFISEAQLWFPKHAVLIGDNNSGKSSVIEAIDLVLGPDRINRLAAIDEHDFYASRYLDAEGNPVPIEVEVTIVDLSPEQIRHFRGNLEFWDDATGALLPGPPIGAIEQPSVKEALRIGFRGSSTRSTPLWKNAAAPGKPSAPAATSRQLAKGLSRIKQSYGLCPSCPSSPVTSARRRSPRPRWCAIA
jgi:AAA ATPase domain